ncbi:hypothetical protein ACFQ48_15365 [Hymenobacter caeli]|uniref:Uncharacterized protein n=1 Tax=Hymenobacter caeli TaxID=2735894 RepID=A0ABX2FR79_9BACT|nr:hypothetical protein [Hymenobacter caeli]NRT19447.1 hypothetical protein [Hymenobacter caeli]
MYVKWLLLVGALAGGAPGPRACGPPPAAGAPRQEPSFPRRRTPVAQLPPEGQAEILRLETLLQQAYAAFTASPTTAVFPYWRADAVEQAAHQAAAVVPTWDQAAYQQETAFYTAEEARRQQARRPAAPKP